MSPTQTAFLHDVCIPSCKGEPFQKGLPSYENRQLLKADIYGSRIQDLILLSLNHSPHSMQIITFLIWWGKINNIDLICLGLGMWGEDPRYTLSMNGCKMIYVMAVRGDSSTRLLDAAAWRFLYICTSVFNAIK